MSKLLKKKILDYKMLPMVLGKHDDKGLPVPFRMKYLCKNGDVIEVANAVTTSVYKSQGTRDIMLLNTKEQYADKNRVGGAQVRTIRDCLILEVNDFTVVHS